MANRLLAAFLLLAAPVLADTPPPRGLTKDGVTKVRAVVQSAIDKGRIPGAVALVTRDGRPVFFEALGQADEGRAMAKDSLFRIASMTKPVTSVAAMMLVEDGKLKLDDPVSRHLPEFADVRVIDLKTDETAPAKRPITVRDLLTHTSGLVYGFTAPERLKKPFAEIAEGLSPLDPTLAENTKRLAKIPLAHQPGAAWTYGMNTDVLGRVVEVASGQALDRFFADRIFTPLKMLDTGFVVPKEKQPRLVALYRPEGKKVTKVTAEPYVAGPITASPRRVLGEQKYLSGGAGLVSSAADYARFLQMLLNGGELDGVRLLKPETVRAMTTNQIGKLDCPFSIHGDKFGLGFGVTTKPAVASVGSYSWAGAYHTFFWVDPGKKFVAVIMTQIYPWGDSTLWADYQKAVYGALENTTPPRKPNPDAQRQAAMNIGGNASRGKALFASSVTKCVVCHKVHGQGGEVGPDLSQVAGKYDRTHLIESVLDPSAQILEGYRTTAVTLTDGRVLRGIVTGETSAGFTLLDAENKRHVIKTTDVESRQVEATSLMPADLTAALSPGEFTDLIA